MTEYNKGVQIWGTISGTGGNRGKHRETGGNIEKKRET